MKYDKRDFSGLGVNQRRALDFSAKYRGWHSFDTTDRGTKSAVLSLAKRGIVEVNRFNQFRYIAFDLKKDRMMSIQDRICKDFDNRIA